MIKLKNVTFQYDKVILNNINLTIPKNKITVIIGKNGSGKSTLANIMSGLLFPQSGEVYLDDMQLTKKTDNKLIRKKVGMVFQNPSNQILFSKVSDDIKFTLENMKYPKEEIPLLIQNSLEKVNMTEYMDSNPYKLSGGEKQRVAIASQLSYSPEYLIFDEATSMIDINGKYDIYQLLKKLKKEIGIIFITNDMNELIYADYVVILDEGSLYKYSLLELIQDNSILSKHQLNIPLLFKIAHSLNITDVNLMNETDILERIDNK